EFKNLHSRKIPAGECYRDGASVGFYDPTTEMLLTPSFETFYLTKALAEQSKEVREGSVDQLTRRAFTSTPASFSSALIKAEAFSSPNPSATADARFFSATRSAGMGDSKLSANFSMRPASLSMSPRAKLVEKSRFKIF